MRFIFLSAFLFFLFPNFTDWSKGYMPNKIAKWISHTNFEEAPNQWIAFRKEFTLKKANQNLQATIAVDSKYWLWINGELIIREGGIKRGSTPTDTYYDEVPIGEYLKKGKNTIAILVWYFGKPGFSHLSSRKAGLFFELRKNDKPILVSGKDWKAKKHPAYYNSNFPLPNFRLSESNVCFDANKDLDNWTTSNYNDKAWENAIEIGKKGDAPWNQLIKRPIPQWKDYGLKPYLKKEIEIKDSLQIWTMTLPYNAQINPFFKINTPTFGDTIRIQTDNYWGGGDASLRAEYITKKGVQEYESLGWISGQKVIYTFPKEVEILDLKFRETGYHTEFIGNFECNDDFYNQLWKKSRRTLYLCMRDTYMDCPERERAQWWGDAVNEIEQSYYAFDTTAYALARKGIYELLNWQRPDSSLFSPIPSIMWNRELPNQMLAAVGKYGIWRYYMQTGDKKLFDFAYPKIKDYLALWEFKEDGLIKVRTGEWLWGDWGENQDFEVLQNAWYYLALTALKDMAVVLDNQEDVLLLEKKLAQFKVIFYSEFWQNGYFKSPNHKGDIDDRANALAVLAGFAKKEDFQKIEKVLIKKNYASPFMERFVLEALFVMGYEKTALNRMKKRYQEMVTSDTTTLWEHWELFKGSTINHGWAGSPLHLLSGYVAGIKPLKAGYQEFEIFPKLGFLQNVTAKIATPYGMIIVEISNIEEKIIFNIELPEKTKVKIGLPNYYPQSFPIKLNHILKIGKKNNLTIFEGTKSKYLLEIKNGGKFILHLDKI